MAVSLHAAQSNHVLNTPPGSMQAHVRNHQIFLDDFSLVYFCLSQSSGILFIAARVALRRTSSYGDRAACPKKDNVLFCAMVEMGVAVFLHCVNCRMISMVWAS